MRPMKDSGVKWLGEIPADWLCRKCKTILSENDGGIWGNDPVGNESDKIVIRSTEQTIDGKWNIEKPATRDLSLIDYKRYRIKKDDLLITKSSGSNLHIGKTTLADDYFIHHECYYSNFLQRIRCSGYSPKLLWYLFNSTIIRAQCVYLQNSTSGLGNINADIISNLYIPVPPLDEQQRIATFLDGECARIDSVIEKTRASIVEYKKLKQVVITRAVTKGIRPARTMKDSGVEWLGEIPADWDAVNIRRLFSFGKGLPITKENLIESGLSVISYGQIHSKFNSGITVKPELIRFVDNDYLQRNPESIVKKGDFIFADTSEDLTGCGNCVYIDIDELIFAGYHTIILRSHREFHNKYFAFLFQSDVWRKQIRERVTGVKLFSISQKILRATSILVPPMEEQKEIAQYLDAKTAAIDLLVEKKEQLLTELERLKKSLIFEYVTGKKAVAQ